MSEEELDNVQLLDIVQGGARQCLGALQCPRRSQTISEEEPDNVQLLDNV